ncbi:dihydrodipicolinate synthase [Aspergillus affinis]|uniref:dihydrodipicolinate synthase n=1 Tax=Aspergillus affinis TaxID=1070780 RepID=UPI0022FDF57B|nr:dihydrodipicolinate synthase [Aspergillus affinis]KAI9044663.1 dihydrodipicolinate synthase [Aspergillus affinis]
MSHVPPAGIYPPLVTYFNEDESIDYDSLLKHVHHVVKGGVTGLVQHGSNGEAVHLLHEEGQQIIARDYPENLRGPIDEMTTIEKRLSSA